MRPTSTSQKSGQATVRKRISKNILPIGQQLWMKELESYSKYPPMQDPETYNLDGVLKQVQAHGSHSPSD
jgi:hypothetical protein